MRRRRPCRTPHHEGGRMPLFPQSSCAFRYASLIQVCLLIVTLVVSLTASSSSQLSPCSAVAPLTQAITSNLPPSSPPYPFAAQVIATPQMRRARRVLRQLSRLRGELLGCRQGRGIVFRRSGGSRSYCRCRRRRRHDCRQCSSENSPQVSSTGRS